MPKSRKKPNLPVAAVEVLAAELAALSRSPFHHSKLTERLAVTFRLCHDATDELPDAHVELHEFRLFALSHRFVDRGGFVARAVLLSIYKAEIDLPGTGRIRFVCDAVMNVGSTRRGQIVPDPRINTSAARAAILMTNEVADADHRALANGLVFPRFHFAFHPGRPPHPEPAIAAHDWTAAEVRIGNLIAWPAEFFTRTTDRVQQPAAVYVDMADLAGRTVRNPAWSVLRHHHVIRNDSYRQFLEQVSPHTGEGRLAPEPNDRTRAAGQFRAALADYVDGGDGRVEALMGDLRVACAAAGVPVPEDDDRAYDFLAGLIEAPWARPPVPGAVIQRIRLEGPPEPGSMTFATINLEADLFELGPKVAGRYDPLPDRRVREMLKQGRIAQVTRSSR